MKVCEPHPLKFTTGQSPDRRPARRLINYVARRNQERGGNDPSPANADGPDDGPLSVTRRPARRVLVRPLWGGSSVSRYYLPVCIQEQYLQSTNQLEGVLL